MSEWANSQPCYLVFSNVYLFYILYFLYLSELYLCKSELYSVLYLCLPGIFSVSLSIWSLFCVSVYLIFILHLCLSNLSLSIWSLLYICVYLISLLYLCLFLNSILSVCLSDLSVLPIYVYPISLLYLCLSDLYSVSLSNWSLFCLSYLYYVYLYISDLYSVYPISILCVCLQLFVETVVCASIILHKLPTHPPNDLRPPLLWPQPTYHHLTPIL